MKLRVLDLFSGIGGFSLGLERAGGFRTVGFCEIEPFARRLLAKHWPDVPNSEDVTEREFVEGEADVITAGFPCQDLSFAGTGAGLSGARSGLYRHVIRAVRLVRPKFALLENVAALLSRGMGAVLGDLAEVGYDAEWHCIPASAVGAPHRRDRIWIIAHAGSEQHEGRRAPFSGEIAQELSQAAMANAPRFVFDRSGDAGPEGWPEPANSGSEVADAYGYGQPRGQERDLGSEAWVEASCRDDLVRRSSRRAPENWWATEPDVGRVAHGVPARVDRLRGLGNAVVPKIPEILGRVIRSAHIDSIPQLQAAE